MYSGTPLIWTLIGQNEVSIQARGEKVVLHRKKKYIRRVSYYFRGVLQERESTIYPYWLCIMAHGTFTLTPQTAKNTTLQAYIPNKEPT